LRIFDCKNPQCQKIYKDAPVITNNLCKNCNTEWETLKEELTLLSVSFVVDPTLVRGLDYYSKTVFEFVSDSLGAQSAFCGGGRYNQLVSQLGGKEDQPSIGAAPGIERLILLLEPIKEQLLFPQKPALHLILPIEKKQNILALLLADTLQNNNFCTDILFEGDSIKSMMRKANKMGAKYVLILGPEEQSQKTVTVKNMITGNSVTILQIDLVDYLKK
jgi:histidyl-tRNA synthetase